MHLSVVPILFGPSARGLLFVGLGAALVVQLPYWLIIRLLKVRSWAVKWIGCIAAASVAAALAIGALIAIIIL